MHLETNYDLCSFICKYIDDTSSNKSEYRHRYFALYIFLLNKMLNAKIDYCKSLVTIYCGNMALCKSTGMSTDDLYKEIIASIVKFNESFEVCLREKKLDDETLLMYALDSVSKNILDYTNTPQTAQAREAALVNMTNYINQVYGVLEALPTNHESLEDFATRHSIDL